MVNHDISQDSNINSKILCNVTSCAYNNDSKHCTASQIKVGHQHNSASTSADTLCITFKP